MQTPLHLNAIFTRINFAAVQSIQISCLLNSYHVNLYFHNLISAVNRIKAKESSYKQLSHLAYFTHV